MVGIMMVVYVKEALAPDIPPHLIDADTVATGIMGIMVRSRGHIQCHVTNFLCFHNKGNV